MEKKSNGFSNENEDAKNDSSSDSVVINMDSSPSERLVEIAKDKSSKKGTNASKKRKKYTITKIDTGDLESIDIESGASNKMHPPDYPMYIQFTDLNYVIKETRKVEPEKDEPFYKKLVHKIRPKTETRDRQILKGINGKVAPGEFLAIMGPTGSGKTTLLGVLARRTKRGVTGQILINGEMPDKDYKRHVAYVLQDDVFFSNITVQKTLLYTSHLRLSSKMSNKDKEEKVDEIISALNIQKARNTIIGNAFKRGISGGERKRVNIGNELLTNPSIILLDEPTSGLDTSTAMNLMRILRGMADSGYTVITTIHQPTSQMYNLFDKLLLLVDGQPIYYGQADKAVTYFGDLGLECSTYYNPADFMMGLILQEELRKTNKVKKQLIEAFNERSKGKKESRIIKKRDTKIFNKAVEKANAFNPPKYPATYWQQFKVLLSRSFFQASGVYMDKLPFIQLIIIALIVGIFWYKVSVTEDRIQDRIGVLFFVGVFTGGFFPLLNAVYNFPPERAVLQKERASGSYRLSAYFIAKSLSELPFQLLFPTLFTLIAYYMIGLRPFFPRLLYMLVILYFSTLASTSIGFAISASVTDVKMAGVVATIIMLGMMLISGFYVDLDKVPVWIRWGRYLSFMKYVFDSLLLNEFDGVNYPQNPNYYSQFDAYSPEIPGIEIARSQRLIVESIPANLGIVFLYAMIVRFIAFILLKYTYKQKT